MERRMINRIGAVVAAVVAALVMWWPSTASAHTEFESSSPADGATVDAPLSEIRIDFTNPAVASGDGFVVLDASATPVAPTVVDAGDGTSFVLTFDPPLAAGEYGVRWEVQAGDAHPIDGSFRFEIIDGAAAPDTAATPTTSIAITSAAPESDAAAPPSAPLETSTTDVLAGAAPVVAGDVDADDTDDALDAALSTADASGDDARWLSRFGRLFTFAGAIAAIGMTAALTAIVRGSRDEIAVLLNWVRMAGIAVLAGGLCELGAVRTVQETSVVDLVTSRPGFAAALTAIGGIAIWLGFHPRAGSLVGARRSLSAAVAPDLDQPDVAPADGRLFRWQPAPSAALGLAGLGAVWLSFALDGHTASRGNWLLHAMIDLVHTGAAAVWAGGAFAITALVVARRRRNDFTDLAGLLVRFSSIATAALAAVWLAGLAMMLIIVDGLGDLTSTEWGRTMLLKLVAVTIATGLGAHQHFRLRPQFEANPHDATVADRVRRALTIESIVFVVVIVLTAWLVGAAT